MTAQVHRLPVAGEPHVTVGTRRSEEGRKARTASSLYTADGELLATAEQIWVAIDPADFS
jgi:acyl-CoA thioesterase FadM